MAFIFVGDPHFSSRGPETRLDEYAETCFDKLTQVVDYAQEHNIKDIILAGDVLTTSDNSTEFINSLIRYFNTIKYQKGIRISTIIGNHDSSYTTYENYHKRQLGTIIASGCVEELIWNKELGILGWSAYAEPSEVPLEEVKYLVVHHFLCKTSSDPLWVLPSECKKKYPNLIAILAGHDHCYYGSQELGGVLTVRPGSLLRQNSNRQENNRTPCFAVIDGSNVQYIPLKCKPFDEIFNTELKDLLKDNDKELEQFLDSFSRVRTESVDTTSFVKQVFEEVSSKEDIEPGFVEFLKQDILDTGFTL